MRCCDDGPKRAAIFKEQKTMSPSEPKYEKFKLCDECHARLKAETDLIAKQFDDEVAATGGVETVDAGGQVTFHKVKATPVADASGETERQRWAREHITQPPGGHVVNRKPVDNSTPPDVAACCNQDDWRSTDDLDPRLAPPDAGGQEIAPCTVCGKQSDVWINVALSSVLTKMEPRCQLHHTTQSPTPPDVAAARDVGDLCRCGHSRGVHTKSLHTAGGIGTHDACCALDCLCARFLNKNTPPSVQAELHAEIERLTAERDAARAELAASECNLGLERGLTKAQGQAIAALEAAAKPAAVPEVQKIADCLVRSYKLNPVLVADICDEKLDRSGALLGYIRVVALAEGK
jgi:hypothetical protein